MEAVPSLHPMYITTSASGAGAGVYSEGVTNNFASGNESLTFTPPMDAPDQLYYQCGTHDFMGGRINLVSESGLSLELVAEGLTHPLTLVEAPDGTGRLFVADQTGQIRVITAEGELLETPFLDLSHWMVPLSPNYDERGLLGLAFHPDYSSNGRFFVYYSAPLRSGAPEGFDHTSRVSEFRVSATNPNLADDASQNILLEVDQPQSNHNAGSLAFHPHDGTLFVSLGDGGGANDVGLGHVADWYEANEGGNAQNVTANLLGKIIRIDVDNVPQGQKYGIPADNPFVGTDGLDEIWAYGFRNPYGMSINAQHNASHDHMVITADAGQDLWEEVSVVERGENYGWNVREGAHCFSTADPSSSPAACPATDAEGDSLIDPVIDFANANQEGGFGNVVVGGHVYGGTELDGMVGSYVFGVWSQGSGGSGELLPGAIFTATPQDEGPWPFEKATIAGGASSELDGFVLGFGQDLSGEVYVLTTTAVGPTGTTGRVLRLAGAEPTGAEGEGERPGTLTVEQNVPNPFSGGTAIRFYIGIPEHVSLAVYDLVGRRVKQLVDAQLPVGSHTVTWDGTDSAGRAVASGTYICRISSGSSRSSRPMMLLR